MPRTKPIPAERKSISPAEFAAELGVSVDKVLEWIRDTKELRAVNVGRIGKRPRYRILAVERVRFINLRSVVDLNAEPVEKKTAAAPYRGRYFQRPE